MMRRSTNRARAQESHSRRIESLLRGRPKQRRRVMLALVAIVGVFVMLAVGVMLGTELLMVIFP